MDALLYDENISLLNDHESQARIFLIYAVIASACFGSLNPSSAEDSEDRSSLSMQSSTKTEELFGFSPSFNSDPRSMSIWKSAFDEIVLNIAFLLLESDIPNLRGLSSPKVKLDVDMSVAQESPPNDTKDDIESLDNRDNLDVRLLLER